MAPTASRRQARRAALVLLYQHDLTGRGYPELTTRWREDAGIDVPDYARGLIDAVEERRDELDAEIGKHAQGWTVDRIAPIERACLRIAVHELLHEPAVPTSVAIDEAVGLAKRYASPEASAFVNGVLGGVARAHGVGR